MFTGLVQDVGRVAGVEPAGHGLNLLIATQRLPHQRLELGSSVACNGVCLTITSHDGSGAVGFFVGPETLVRTDLARLSPGDRVNLELALRMGDELGGHVVLGHVDGCALVHAMEDGAGDQSSFLTLKMPQDWMAWVVQKGSIAIKGVSLTVAAVDAEGCLVRIMLIPHTLDHTNLRALRPGDAVEVECDTQVKAVSQAVLRLLPVLMEQWLSGGKAPLVSNLPWSSLDGGKTS
jgi:riboflavin synthase